MIDYHLHTPLCRHASGKLEEYVKEGERRGLQEVGFADHFPLETLGFKPKIPVTMKPGELPRYVENVQQAASTASIPVKTGIEVDYLPGTAAAAKEVLKKYPFDYVIGSVHFIGSWDCTHPLYRKEFERRSLGEVYLSYFELIWEACRSGVFDIIAHADAVKKFGHRIPLEQMEPLYRETARVMQETGVCLEINAAGLDTEAGEIYPSRELVKACLQNGVEVTLGSDAHEPGQVARHFSQIKLMLQEEGADRVAVFRGRRKEHYYLDGGK